MGENDNSLIAMTLERLNDKFDSVIETISEMKLAINSINANNDRFIDSIKHIHERIDNTAKDLETLKGQHMNFGCQPLQAAVKLRDSQLGSVEKGLGTIDETIKEIKKDVDGLKYKIALYSGGISVLVTVAGMLFKGLGK